MSFTEAFCSLSELLDEAQSDLRCPYLGGKSRCRSRIGQEAHSSAKPLLAQFSKNATLPFDFFEDLAGVVICYSHAKYNAQAQEQWYTEWKPGTTTKRVLFASDSRCKEGSMSDDDHSGSDTADDFLDAEDGYLLDEHVAPDEDGSHLSSQSSPEFNPPVQLTKVGLAKKVTLKLENRLKLTDYNLGWVYVIASPRFEGMLKIGYSKHDPDMNRLKTHGKCYGDFELVTKEMISHAHRVEQLLLAEFANEHHKLKKCGHCPRGHKEWLKIDRKTLQESLSKWKKFTASCPYNIEGNVTRKADFPPPASRDYCRRRSSANSTPTNKNTSSGKGSSKKGTPTSQDTPSKRGSKNGTPTNQDTPSKRGRPKSSPLVSPVTSRTKTMTVVTEELASDEKKSDEKKSDEKKSDEKKSDEKKSDEKKSDEKKSDEKKSDEKKSDETPSESISFISGLFGRWSIF